MKESYSIRQLGDLSGYSKSKLHRIKDHWLGQLPKEDLDFSLFKYLLLDGTYFHKKGCLIIVMDVPTQKIIMNAYVDKESYASVYPLLQALHQQGLMPRSVTMDGHRHVIRAIKDIWPHVHIQRCLYHIQREGMRWLRTFPRTQAGKQLRLLLSQLNRIDTAKHQRNFFDSYATWNTQYHGFVKALPNRTVAFKDLKRTMALINNAKTDMFHYLKDPGIVSTTNILESFYSRLKADFRRHRGLSETHKKAYLKWYCYFKNRPQ